MILTPKQYEAAKYLADKESEEILYGGGAGGGKSAFGALWLIDRCTRLPGTRWVMGRARLKTLKETTLKSFFEVAKKVGLSSDQFSLNNQSGIIRFSNGSEILMKDLFAYPSDPNFDELGSLEITGAFVDEANQITVKARNILKSRMRYRLDDYNIIPKLLMTCNPAKNFVYHDYYKPAKAGNLPKHRKFVQSLVTDNPHISKHYINNLQGLDQVSKERLLFGNWEYDDDPTKLINFDSILDLWSNTFVNGGDYYVTADIARLGSDKAVIMLWNGLRVEEIHTMDKSRITDIQQAIEGLKSRYNIVNSRIIADEDGVGGGLIDYMKIWGFVNNAQPINKENYSNLKSQCYYLLAKYVNEGKIFIGTEKHKSEIIAELEQVKSYKIDSDTKLRVLPKDQIRELIGRSPDFADALMMRMFFEAQPLRPISRKVF